MARRLGASLVFLALCGTGVISSAQPAAAPNPTPEVSGRAAPLAFSQSVVPLNGPWKFQIGDSPADPQTGKPLWAEPHFDDSYWETIDLTPKPGSVDPYTGDPRYVPGWTKLGHPEYMGWAWYRITLPELAIKGERLALEGPYEADDGYQVFFNGELLGSFGKFDNMREPPVVYFSEPAMFLLPPDAAGDSADQGSAKHVLAFRMWMGPTGMLLPEPGGLHYAPLLGGYRAIAAQNTLDWHKIILAHSFGIFEGASFLLLGIVAASLILFDRSDPVYLWVSGVLLLSAGIDALLVVACWTLWVNSRVFVLVVSILLPIVTGVWVMVWWVWFHLRSPAWVPKAIAALTLAYMVFGSLASGNLAGTPPHLVGVAIYAAMTVALVLLLALLVFILAKAIREYGLAAWLVIPAVVPLAIGQFSSELPVLGLPTIWHPFGITVFVGEIANVLMTAAISLLLLRRLLISIRRQRQMALDVKQAQEVQRVLMPKELPPVPGLAIETEYRPAREVGGDFFQIVEHPTDGSVLIVAGDVVGKGLKAGMLVALLVGAIRTATDSSLDPEFVLGVLNKRLLRRGDAQATCLALGIAKDGAVTLANAGHIAPYLNGEPVAMEGALPLGMIEATEFSVLHFQLRDCDKLILMSDGIAEATDANGKLFGFERVQELVRTAQSAADVAAEAQRFGQEDDISVISITRTVALEALQPNAAMAR
jgi:Stage II sporulation protein E (SpoIIE)